MKVNFKTPISFQSIPLYNVKLKKQNPDGSVSELPATFSKLKRSDEEDRELVKDLNNTWESVQFISWINNDFFDSRLKHEDFYIIESKDKNGKKEVYSIAEFCNFWDSIQFLQANPKNKERGVKGSGEVMLWGIGQEKKKPMHDCFSLIPTPESEGFYKQAGLKDDECVFTLKAIHTKSFLKRIEDKYNFSLEPAGERCKNEN